MTRTRLAVLASPGVAGLALLSAAAMTPPAVAAGGRPGAMAAAAAAHRFVRPVVGVPGISQRAVRVPSLSRHTAVLLAVSCASLSFCGAVGFFFNESIWPGLGESWDGTQWAAQTLPGQASRSVWTVPGQVSCSADGTCMLVGEHYSNSSRPALLAESLRNGTWTVTQWEDPAGTRLGWLGGVSCPRVRMCVAVGATSPGNFRREHMLAERWTGRRWVRLGTPAPGYAFASELNGVSCVSATKCVAVGKVVTAAGRIRAVADVWNGRRWSLTPTPNVAGKAESFFEDVSCAAATRCVAVGVAYAPFNRQFAETWSAGRWRLATLPPAARRNSGLLGVSCPTTSMCMASGFSGAAALTEEWAHGTWHTVPAASLTGTWPQGILAGVSCISTTRCEAVGYRYKLSLRINERTLAETWNGSSWTVQATVDP